MTCRGVFWRWAFREPGGGQVLVEPAATAFHFKGDLFPCADMSELRTPSRMFELALEVALEVAHTVHVEAVKDSPS